MDKPSHRGWEIRELNCFLGRVWSADERAHEVSFWDRGWTSATHQAPLVLNGGQTEHSLRGGKT